MRTYLQNLLINLVRVRWVFLSNSILLGLMLFLFTEVNQASFRTTLIGALANLFFFLWLRNKNNN